MTQTIFVQGLQKTSTSTMVGLLNSHPEVFVMYETNLFEARVSKYGNQLLAKMPEARKFFQQTKDTAAPYKELNNFVTEQTGETFKYFGDKLLSFDATLSQPEKNKVIYTLRDARSWLVKDLIKTLYRTDIDCVRPAVEFLKFTMQAKTSPKALCVRLDDLLEDETKVIEKLNKFLGVKIDAQNWLKNAQTESKKGIKAFQNWQKSHPSANVSFKKSDVTVELKDHPFWAEYMSLFEKYYNLENAKNISAKELAADFKTAEGLVRFSPATFDDLYASVEQIKLARPPVKKALKIKIRQLIGKGKQTS